MATPNGEENYRLYAGELTEIFADKMADSNNIVHDKYITISSEKKNAEEARTFFNRVGNDLSADFAKLSSHTAELGYKHRLRIFYDFFHNGDGYAFSFDMKKEMAKGKSFKDIISPDCIEFKSDHIRMGSKFARGIFLKEYPSFLKDSMLSELTDFSRSMMLSVDIQPIPTDDAVKEVQKKLLAIETDITKWQQKQNMNNNFSANIPYEMEQMRKEIKEFLDDLTTRDQRMMFVTVTLVHIADTLDELNNDTETLLSIGRKHLCNFAVLKYQQEGRKWKYFSHPLFIGRKQCGDHYKLYFRFCGQAQLLLKNGGDFLYVYRHFFFCFIPHIYTTNFLKHVYFL